MFSVTGAPALALPCGFSSAGLPLGMQIAGRPFEDGTCSRSATRTREPPAGASAGRISSARCTGHRRKRGRAARRPAAAARARTSKPHCSMPA